MTEKYLYVGHRADTLASGRPVAPGDPVPAGAVDPDDPHDAAMLEEGRLIEPSHDAGYDAMKLADLQAEVDKRELPVTGTGADGKVLKADLVAVLVADDADQTDDEEATS